MWDKFFIILQKGIISIKFCKKGEFTLLRKEGEEEQEFDEQEFWSWFKEKIDYEGEELSFVVVTDRKNFSIPSDIKLSKSNKFEEDSSCRQKIEKIADHFSLLFFPPMKTSIKIQVKTQKKLPLKKEVIKKCTKKTIADVFEKLTMEYQNGR